MTPSQQRVQSMQVTISDATSTRGASVGTGQGVALLSLDFEIGIKKGGFKNMPSGARY